VRVWGSRLLKK